MSSHYESVQLQSDVVFVERSKLLEKLRENREAHKAAFDEAYRAWREKAVAALQEAAHTAAKPDGEINALPLRDLPKPTSFLKSYDEAIVRMEIETRGELVLTEKQFAAWVNDDWTWRDAFVGTTSLYNSGALMGAQATRLDEFFARADRGHEAEVAKGLHDTQCEWTKSFRMCHCSKRRREAEGFTKPPSADLYFPPPYCPKCLKDLEHSGDDWRCYTCNVSWDLDGSGSSAEFTDDYGDIEMCEEHQRRGCRERHG